MKIEKNFFLICENAILDEKGLISLIKIFDTIHAEKLPAIRPQLTFVANLIVQELSKKDENITMSIKLISPSGKAVKFPDVTRKIKRKGQKTQNEGLIMDISGIRFLEFGQYKALLSVNGKQLSGLSFYLEKLTKGQNGK